MSVYFQCIAGVDNFWFRINKYTDCYADCCFLKFAKSEHHYIIIVMFTFSKLQETIKIIFLLPQAFFI